MASASADGLAFVDHTPVRNSAYVPADASNTATDALISEEHPTTLLGKVGFHINQIRAYKDERFKTLKPWGDFFDRNKFSVPGKMEAFSRANKNLSHFYSNYVIVATISSLYVLVINPSFLISMFVVMAMYYYLRMKSAANEPLVLFGKEVSLTQGWMVLILFGVISFYFTGGSSTIFWLVLSSLGTVMGHAVFREPPMEASSLGFASYV